MIKFAEISAKVKSVNAKQVRVVLLEYVNNRPIVLKMVTFDGTSSSFTKTGLLRPFVREALQPELKQATTFQVDVIQESHRSEIEDGMFERS